MTRKKMIKFLEGHFRYDTMNGWNASTSYAANVKVHSAISDKSIDDVKYDFLDCEEAFDDINFIIGEFDKKYEHRYQIGFNGRSRGYLVLYQGGVTKRNIYTPEEYAKKHPSGAYAEGQGWKTEKEARKSGLYNKTIIKTFTYTGKGMDMHEDFDEWGIAELKDRVKLVKDFDKTVRDCIYAYSNFCKSHIAVEETRYTPYKVTVAQEV